MAGVNKERKNGGCKQVNCLKSRFSFVDLGLKFLKEDTSLKLVLYLLNVLRSMVVSISENSFVVVSFFVSIFCFVWDCKFVLSVIMFCK